MDLLAQSSLLVAVVSFALGASTLTRNVKNKLFLAFAVTCTILSGWAIFFFFDRVVGLDSEESVYYRLHLLFNIWLAPSGLILIQVMTRITDPLSRRLLDFSILCSLFLTVALIFNLDTVSFVRGLIFFSPFLVLIQIGAMVWIDRRIRRGIKLLPKLPTVGFLRRNVIYFGGIGVLALASMDHLPWLGTTIPALGNLFLTVYLFFLSQAVTQQRLLNFSALIVRFLVISGVALILTSGYSLLVAWIQDSPAVFFLNSFLVSFFIVTLLEPLRSLLRYLTQRFLTQENLKLEQIVSESIRKLMGVTDTYNVFQNILLFIQQTLQPQSAALYALGLDGTKFRRVRVLGAESNELQALREVLSSHPVLDAFRKLKQRGELPILLDQVLESEIDRSASQALKQNYKALLEALKAFDCNLIIPILTPRGSDTLAFVTVKAPHPPAPWGSNWGLLSIIYPYFEQTAVSLQNMEVYVRQREKERLATLGELSAGLAHEIRNPLGAILGAIQVLNPTRFENSTDGKFLKIIQEEGAKLNSVVTQFLDYSKAESIQKTPIDLGALTHKVIEHLRPFVDPKIEFKYYPSFEKIMIQASGDRIQQVLVNLIQNSVKALENVSKGAPTIQISLQKSKNKKMALLVIEDNGHGIRREHIEKLFIPFFTTSPSGTGLGLPISQKIIEAHGGRIEVASEEGRFARFSIEIPFLQN